MKRTLLDFTKTAGPLLRAEPVLRMARWRHHGRVTCLDHSLLVAWTAYRWAGRLGLDEGAAARGGLLHDLYLYDPRDKSAHPGPQCMDHPRIAARNAGEVTELTEKERNIILSHMWPLGGQPPRSPEAVLVNLADTACAVLELSGLYRPIRLRKRLGLAL